MAKQYKVLVNTGKAENNSTVDVPRNAAGKDAVRIKAKAGAKYQLQELNEQTGNKPLGPDYVKTKRVGKNLHILFEGETEASVIIEDYYEVSPEGYNGLIGQAENGNFYEYIPEDPKTDGLVPNLRDGAQAINVALGGNEVQAAGAAVAAFAFGPLLGSLGLAGAAAAAAAAGGAGATGGAVIPATPSGLTITDDVGSKQGPVANAGVTDDTTPTLSGKGDAGSVVTIKDGDTILGSTTVGPDGNWSFTPSAPLAKGPHSITTTATDAAGNTSAPSTAQTFTIDTDAPAAPTIGDLTDNVPTATGSIASGASTDDTTPTLTGKAEQGSTVEIFDTINGVTTLIGTATVDAQGNWSFTPPVALAAGAHSWTVKAVDAAGNEGPASAARPFTVAGDANSGPAAPAINNVTDNAGTVTGDIPKNGTSDDNTPTVSGTGTPGTVVTVFNGTTPVGSATVGTDGKWSVTTSALTGPGVSLSARATDAAGQTSPATGAYPYTLDTSAPAKPSFTATDNVPTATGTIANNSTTDDTTPTFGGTTEAGATVTIKDGNTVLGTAVADANGNWSFTPTTPLANGAHSITTTATDAAGNTSPTSDTLNFNIDASAVVVSITKAVDNVAANTGDLADKATTNDTTPTLVGKAPANTVVTIREGNTVIGSTTADANGNWSFTTPEQSATSHTYTASATNAAGNTGTSTFTLNVDNVAPATPSGLTITDDVGSKQGPVANAGVTDDTTPTLSGKGDAGSVVTIKDGDTILGSTTVGPDGNWSFTPSAPLAKGPHSITTTATDAAGNTSAPSTAQTFTVDTTGPSQETVDPLNPATGKASLVLDKVTSDDIISAAESATTIAITGKARGDFTTGDTVTLTINSKTFTGTVAADGTFSINVPGADLVADTDTLIDATLLAHDAAGNPGTITATKDYTAKTTAPNDGKALALTIDTDANNDGLINFSEIGNTNGTAKTVINVTASFDKTKVAVGDVITFTDTATGGAVKTVTLDAAAITAGKVSTSFTSPGDGGTFSVKATIADTLGNTSPVANDTASLDLSNLNPVSPSTKQGVAIQITTDGNNDNILNTTELNGGTTAIVRVTLPTDAKAGDVLVITGTGNTAQSITLSASQVSTGNLSVTFNTPANGSKLEVTATVTDASGNTSNVATDFATINTTPVGAPTVVIATDGNNDGFINKAELGNATTVSVNTTLPNGAAVGETITVTDGTTTKTHVLVQADLDKGFVTDSFTAPANGGTFNVTATLTNNANNTSAAGTDKAVLDTSSFVDPTDSSKTGLKVTLDTDGNNDGFINGAELTSQFKATITLPGQAAAGDTVTLNASGNNPRTITLTAQHITDGKVIVSDLTPTGDGTTFKVSASISDKAGNTSPTPDATDSADIKSSAPNGGVAPTVEITTDADNDGFVNATEIGSATTFTVKGSFDKTKVMAGDKLIFTDGTTTQTVTLSGADIGNGFATTTFAKPAEGGTLSVTAKLQDSLGNATASSAADSAKLDTSAPNGEAAPTVEITTDSNNDGFVNPTELGNATTFTVKGSFDKTKVVAGDILVFTDGTLVKMVTLSAGDITNGFATTTFAKPAEGGTLQVTATVMDAAGNVASESLVDQAQLDTTGPAQETTDPLNPAVGKASLVLDAVTADNIVNSAEGAQANVAITGKARGEFTAGDVVTLTVNGKTFTGAVNAQGVFSINVPGSDLLADGDKTIDASLAAKDAAGNTGTVTDTQVYTIDTTAPTTTVDITAISTDSGVSTTDFITNDNNGLTISATLSAALATGEKLFYSRDNGVTWTDITGSVTGTAVSAVDSQLTSTSTIQMQVRDAAGNAGASDTQLVIIDTSPSTNVDPSNPNTPQTDANTSATVSIDAISTDSGVSTTDFITNDNTLSYSGTIAGFTANGDVVELVLKDSNGLVVGSTFATPAANGNWSWNDTGVTRTDGNYTLVATLVDKAGNRVNTAAGGTDSQVVTIDTDAGKNTDNGSSSATPQTDANATNASIGITTIVDSALNSNDTGTSDTDLITQDGTIAVKGTVGNFVTTGNSAGDTVRVQIVNADGSIAREDFVTPDSAGNWTLNNTANTLADGVYTLKAAIVDKAGNTLKSAVDKTLVIDNSASANPANNNGPDTNNETTASVSVTAIDDGNNATGNADGSKDNGTFNNDFVTNDNTLVIKGTTANFSATGATNGDRVRVQLLDEAGTTVVAQAFVLPDSNGAWTWDRTGTQQADGKYNLKADIVDAAGNIVKAGNTQPLTIDTSATNNPNNGSGSAGTDSNATSTLTLSITSINDTANGSADTGSSTTDFITNDQTLIIQGTAAGFSTTGAQAGDQLRVQLVKADGTVVRSAFVTVDGSGNWSLDNKANTLAAGTYTIKADVMDLAGNTVKSTTQALVVDVSNNELVTANFINKDTPSNGTTGIDVSNTDWKVYTDGVTRGQTIFTTLGAGETISKAEISLDGGSTWTAGEVTGNLAKFFVNDVFATTTTSFEYKFRTTDVAGNLSAVSSKTVTVQDLASNTSATSITTESETVLPTTNTLTNFRGDDKKQNFTADANTIANYLDDATPTANWVHAGAGMDTLKVIGTDTTLNLNKLTTDYTLGKLQGFEVIDLKSDAAAQTVIGSGLAFASFGNSTWLTNSSLLAGYQVVIRGDAADTLVLSPGDGYDTTGWVKGAQITGAGTNVFNGIKFDVWSNASLNVQLLVEELVVVSNKFVSFDAISTDTGTSSTDLITTDTTLSLSGAVSGTVSTDIVKVTVLNSSNVKVIDNVTASVTNGLWTLNNQANALALGDYTVKTTITNAAGTVLATGQDRIVKILAANDAPVDTGLAALSTNEDTAVAITGLSVTDASNNGDNYTVTLGVTNGTLTVSGGSATISGSGTNTVTLTGTKAAVNATLAATVSFVPTGNFNGNAQLTMSTNDGSLGDAKTDSDTVTITVNSVNDAPVVTPSTTARSYAENAGAIQANDTLTLSDADTANLSGATVQITSGLTTGDVLGFVNANGISGSYNAGTGTLTLSGSATVAQYQAALQSVTYVNTGDNPTTTQRTLSWRVNDGQSANNLSNVGTSTIDVTVVNDQPTSVDLFPNMLEDAGTPVNGTTTGVLVSTVTAGKDADNTNVGIAITGPVNATFGTAFYSLDGGATWRNLNTDAANASVTNALLLGSTARLWFAANPNINGTLGQTNMRLWDGTDGGISGNFKDISAAALTSASGAYSATTKQLKFSVANVNDAPTLTATVVGGTQTVGTVSSVSAFSGAVAKAGGLSGGTVFDAADNIKALGLTVSGLQDGANETITVDGTTIALTAGTTGTTATNGMSFSVAVTSGTATVSLSKTAGVSMANIATLVNGISYSNTATTATEGNRVLTLTSLQDTGGTANGGVDTATLSLASTIVVGPANAAPVANPTSVASTPLISADAVEVTITDNQSAARVANGTEVTFTLKFSQAITASSLTASDIVVDNGTLVANSLIQVDATTWTVKATAAATGVNAMSLSIADGSYTSAAGTNGTGGSGVQTYGTIISQAGSAIDGTASRNSTPTGWTALSGTTPDLNDNNNTAWAGVLNTTFVNGQSLNGGQWEQMMAQTITEGMTSTLTGLTVGQTYTYGVQWQQIQSSGTSQSDFQAGGQLKMTVNGVTKIFTSSGLEDEWQTALITFVATSTTASVQLSPNDTVGKLAAAAGSAIAVDSLTAAQITALSATEGLVLTGTSAAESLVGSDNADTITLAGGGSDKVFAGAGNDIVNIDNASRSALVDPNTPNMIVDGGTGINALVYTTGGTQNPLIDLTDRNFITDNNSATTAVQSKLRNFSTIDITGGTTAVNSTIKLDYAFINNISGASDNAATNLSDESRMLVINGNAGDVVQLVNLADWSVSANQSGESLAATYGSAFQFKAGRSYKEFKLNGATLFVDSTATVNTATATTTTTVVTGQGVSVQTLFGPSFTDVDSGQTFKGVAITNAGATADLTNKGKFQISADGTTWTDLAAGLTDSTAIFAAPTALIRFVGKAGVELPNPQDLTVRLIDSSGLTGTSGTLTTGQTINASVNGGATAFSGNLVTLSNANVAPVSTDADGVIGGDALGAVVPTVVDPVITGNGTFTAGGTTITVTGNTGTNNEVLPQTLNVSAEFKGQTFLTLGDQNSDETANFAFSKPTSSVVVDFVGLQNSSLESVRVLVNGQPFVMKASYFTAVYDRTSSNAATTPVIASDGLSFTASTSSSSSKIIDGTFIVNAADVPGGVINSISLMEDYQSGIASGVLFRVRVADSSFTAAQTVAQLFGGVYSDANADAMAGVVVTSAGTAANLTALGKYQFSSNNGTTWTDLAGGLTDSTSVYLTKTDLVRFVASATNGSTNAKQDLVVRLVDDSLVSGNFTSGATVDASGTKNGGSTAISGNTVSLGAVANAAPVLASSTITASATPIDDGTGVSKNFTMDAGNDIYIKDLNAADGSAITFSTQTFTNDGTATFLDMGSSKGGDKRIYLNQLSTRVDVYTSEMLNPGQGGVSGYVRYYSADGTLLNTNTFTTDSIFSASVNNTTNRSFTAPAGKSIAYVEVGGGDNWGWVDKVVFTPVTGTPVIDFSKALLASVGASIASVMPAGTDADGSVIGYAVTSAAAETTTGDSTPGKWQYFNGSAWVDLTAASTTQAIYISKSTLVRWSDNDATSYTALKLVAVDSTISPTLGQTLNVTTRGGSTAFSAQEAVLSGTAVAPVVLDLNRDGTVSYVDTVMDINDDGALDSTHWAAAQDGVLVWDKYHDGMVHDQSQYAFAQYGGSTDLTGLAAGFDSNHDGKLNAADAKFAEFKVWQDLNGNGVSDAGEVRSLADVGITEINLVSDGVVRTPAAGVHEAGRSTATLADGTSVLVADAGFVYHTATAAELASHAIAQGESVFKISGGMSLDLSGVTQAAKLAALDLSADSAANTVKLTLADVLGAACAEAVASGNAVHQLKLTGDINDTAVFSANEWTHSGTVVTDNGHDYAVYNASNGAAAQLLVDHHMLVSHNG